MKKIDVLLMIVIILALVMLFGIVFEGNAAPAEVWLTPARVKALSRISKPRIVAKERKGDVVVYQWDDGLHKYATTQTVRRVTGKAARSAWGTKLKAREKENSDLLEDIRAIKDNPTKKNLENLISKHEKKALTVKDFEFSPDGDYSVIGDPSYKATAKGKK